MLPRWRRRESAPADGSTPTRTIWLAHAYRPRESAAEAFTLEEAFRPAVPEGVKGWGAKDVLDLRKIRLMAKR